MANKMQVWPGPRIMVPIPTDVLLVGEPDLPQAGDSSTGTPLSSTKTNYFDLFLPGSGGKIQDDPFNVVPRDAHLEVGAHLMWTLPYSLRKGKQEKNASGQDITAFPNAPNRWLITRFEYASVADGSAPKVTAQLLKSNELQEAAFPADPLSSDYPLKQGSYPVSKIGKLIPLSAWDGTLLDDDQKVDIKAIGPGTVSWSVTYDNVRNVFGFHDENLNTKATAAAPYYYTYLIVGWYDQAELDALNNIDNDLDPNDPGKSWLNIIQSQFDWSLGDSSDALKNALDDWSAWQKSHGLDGTFEPDDLDLPPQAKANIIAWHKWQQDNGSTATEPVYAKQLLCHSLISSVEWKGDQVGYASGNPVPAGEYPDLAAGNTAVESIATFMADLVVNNPGDPQPASNIPIIARALEAFQKDLLYDYQKDPVRVENLLHEATFSKSSSGKEWVVVRTESTKNDELPSTNAGKQSIPLDATDTQALIDLNTQQADLNALNNTISSQRDELNLLSFKKQMISLNKNGSPIPADIVKKVEDSIQAISGVLNDNISKQGSLSSAITTAQTALQTKIQADFILKSVDLPSYNLPNDPVIMVAGAKQDTKFSKTAVNISNNQLLDVRYTGQTVDSFKVSAPPSDSLTISAKALLEKVIFPDWNAFPKEVMDLWVESLLLDTSAAGLMAKIYQESTSNTTPLAELITSIQQKQSSIWSDLDAMQYPRQAILNAAGFTGVAPAEAGVAFRTKQPWTPIFMDWSVKWIPTSLNSTAPFTDWDLGEIDYEWSGARIPDEDVVELTGRSILSPEIAQNIQSKLAGFLDDPNYKNLPKDIRSDLVYIAGQIKNFDILTQSVTGFTQSLITKLTAGSLGPDNSTEGQEISDLLAGNNQSYVPELGPTTCSGTDQQYAPIRSGHIQLRNVWVIDAFGQIMYAAPNVGNVPPKTHPPLTTVKWSESLTTPVASLKDAYGELAPRLSQSAKVDLQLLQQDNDSINTNSADATSPICGWVMANHLDNSLMVFDKDGNNLGAIIKVQSETTSSNWSIRWDSAPGLNTTLGAPPKIVNDHLSAFVTGLLDTRFEGAGAFEDLMASIDSSLWTFNDQAVQKDNMTLLVGKPLAVVRAEVSMDISGDPIYQQSWCDTGKYYNDDGTYKTSAPPYLSIPFSLRVGDAQLNGNGVMGYFEADNYDQFYSVYGVNGETSEVGTELRAGATVSQNAKILAGDNNSSYVEPNHVVKLKPDGTPVKLTVIMDSSGILPVFPGSLPFRSQQLPNGPVTEALNNLKASFRVGPVLIDPASIKMPLPSEVKGKWSWRIRDDVNSWSSETDLKKYTPKAVLDTKPLRLTEGWLLLEKDEDQ